MRKWRAKPQVRVVKDNPKSGHVNQVHDEDALRWKLMVSEKDAVALVSQAGPATPCLPANQTSPSLPADGCLSAVDYTRALPEETRQAIFRHCQLVSRHEQQLLEGQERLKYMQAQLKEVKARLPPPSQPQPSRDPDKQTAAPQKGPSVQVIPVPQPSCWASCCGLMELPPELPPVAAAPPPPPVQLPIPLPSPAYFQEAAWASAAARRRQTAASQGGGGSTGGFPGPQAAGGGCSSTPLQPVSASVGGASDGGVTRHAAQGPSAAAPQATFTPAAPARTAAADATATAALGGATEMVEAGELPGQLLHVLGEEAEAAEADRAGPLGAATKPSAPAVAAAAAGSSAYSTEGRTTAGGLRGPQSATEPATEGPPSAGVAVASLAKEEGELGELGGGFKPAAALAPPLGLAMAAGRSPLVPPLFGKQQALGTPQSLLRPLAPLAPLLAPLTAAEAQPGRSQSALPPLRSMGSGGGPSAAAARPLPAGVLPPPLPPSQQQPLQQLPAPAPDYLSRYQEDPEALRRVVRIQAAQRGRLARKQVDAMRAGASAGVTAASGAVAGTAADNTGSNSGGGTAGGSAASAGGGTAGAEVARAEVGGRTEEVVDLSRYQDAESLRRLTALQAAQRGRLARKQVAQLRRERAGEASG